MNAVTQVCLRMALVCATVGLAAGCASNGMNGGSSAEQIVAERAEARWGYMIERRFTRAYEYLSPGTREMQSIDNYVMRMGRSVVNWRGVEVTDVVCSTPTRCELEAILSARVAAPVPRANPVDIDRTINETWVLSQGNWYFVPD